MPTAKRSRILSSSGPRQGTAASTASPARLSSDAQSRPWGQAWVKKAGSWSLPTAPATTTRLARMRTRGCQPAPSGPGLRSEPGWPRW